MEAGASPPTSKAEAEAAEAGKSGVGDSESEGLAWSWSYVALCLLFPITGGAVTGFPWAGATLHVKAMGWDMLHLAITLTSGMILRAPCSLSLVWFGQWFCLVHAIVHLACTIPALVNPEDKWAVLLQLLAANIFDTMIPNDALAFLTLGTSQIKAQQASRTVLQNYVVFYALASAVGGALYQYTGWRGMAAFHLAMQIIQVLALLGCFLVNDADPQLKRLLVDCNQNLAQSDG